MINYRGLRIPFTSFGNVSSDDLFCDKEQALFDFYAANYDRYKKALDIGANIGVHTMLMLKAGWYVKAYEPDPVHFKLLYKNLVNNGFMGGKYSIGHKRVEIAQWGVSDHSGTMSFVRVLGNTTGSHILGDKEPYGPTRTIAIEVCDCKPLFEWADFAKIDCEGHEAKLLTAYEGDPCDFMVEVGNYKNAQAIFKHFHGRRKLWGQNNQWREIKKVGDMPSHHSHGALFISDQPPFQ